MSLFRAILSIAIFAAISVNAYAEGNIGKLTVTGSSHQLVLNVTTNLPATSILMVSLANPKNDGGDGFFGQAKGTVKSDQTVQFGPFSNNGNRLAPGNYSATISTVMAALQPEAIQSFFGKNGKNLRGSEVQILDGTTERYVSKQFHFTLQLDGKVNSSLDEANIIGSPEDTWEKVELNGYEAYVQTNARYFKENPPLSTAEHHSGYGFVANVVTNSVGSTIVGSPQSKMTQVEGNCETRHYSVLGTVSFAGRNRSGVALETTSADNVERIVSSNSLFEKAFDLLCKTARQQMPER